MSGLARHTLGQHVQLPQIIIDMIKTLASSSTLFACRIYSPRYSDLQSSKFFTGRFAPGNGFLLELPLSALFLRVYNSAIE